MEQSGVKTYTLDELVGHVVKPVHWGFVGDSIASCGATTTRELPFGTGDGPRCGACARKHLEIFGEPWPVNRG
jgi:hypothetical protein